MFKLGDTAIVIANYSGHGFRTGERIILESGCGASYKAKSLDNPDSWSWYISAKELKPARTLAGNVYTDSL